ncbi:MAG: DUF4299 domain-containing protein [Clostridia bacterium]|nr:DUF4299 domain-containing protein [Clostridia bacterium]
MGLFDKFKKKEINDWENAYAGNPNFYNGKDGKPFGAFALTEGTLTTIPKNPRLLYKVDNTEVNEWKLILVSTTNNVVLGNMNYYEAINKLMKFAIDEKDNNILIRGLSLEELNELLK